MVNLNFDCKKKKDEINKMICIVYSYIISLVLNIQTMNLDEMISFPQLTQKNGKEITNVIHKDLKNELCMIKRIAS